MKEIFIILILVLGLSGCASNPASDKQVMDPARVRLDELQRESDDGMVPDAEYQQLEDEDY